MARARVSRVVRALVVGLLAGALVAAWSTRPAEAQEAPLEFGGTVIEGKVLAPEVTVFISRENLVKDYNIVLEESFLHKIVESVRNPPF